MITDIIGTILGSPEFAALVLTAFATAVTAVVGWVGYAIRRHILRRLDAEELAFVERIAYTAVRYVEMKLAKADNKAKFDAAMLIVQGAIDARGIKIHTDQLVAIIEAAVFMEKAKYRDYETVVLSEPQPL